MHTTDLVVLLFICAVVAASIVFRKLTVAGALTGGILAALLYKGAGITGIVMLCAFFVAGSAATALGRSRKEQLGIAEQNKGQRNAWQVLANGGIAALLALAALADAAHSALYHAMLAGSLAAAASDTLSSELGMVYGRSHYNILTFKKDIRGLDGVVSLEGTLAGIAGAFAIALVYALAAGFNKQFFFVGLAGVLGNLADSVLGAAWERKRYIGNDLVNFLNTLFAALCVWLFISAM